MHFIDRLLQGRRIVTKALLFVVPLVAEISAATSEQSTGIQEVSRAVHDVELITQQNAAMVEENNAAIHGLCQRVDMLSEKIERFRTRGPGARWSLVGGRAGRPDKIATGRIGTRGYPAARFCLLQAAQETGGCGGAVLRSGCRT
ncbi:methyl-accepting chemotaxis protein (MCP) signaling protein [Rhizobium sullae]|uniref:Methyl-accepting chemotaxis protein (MCP) signaling protein n=1 Tax=Rhizobium sullae TaxID=50338 RepID=A0A4R3PX42_RHISU|nr:methyl-accepting chemotaxis protein (MCP) signaling protein [Rhizobium sullae]